MMDLVHLIRDEVPKLLLLRHVVERQERPTPLLRAAEKRSCGWKLSLGTTDLWKSKLWGARRLGSHLRTLKSPPRGVGIPTQIYEPLGWHLLLLNFALGWLTKGMRRWSDTFLASGGSQKVCTVGMATSSSKFSLGSLTKCMHSGNRTVTYLL